jgi:hypothetical protein
MPGEICQGLLIQPKNPSKRKLSRQSIRTKAREAVDERPGLADGSVEGVIGAGRHHFCPSCSLSRATAYCAVPLRVHDLIYWTGGLPSLARQENSRSITVSQEIRSSEGLTAEMAAAYLPTSAEGYC